MFKSCVEGWTDQGEDEMIQSKHDSQIGMLHHECVLCPVENGIHGPHSWNTVREPLHLK
jgi:hypothetical protein